MVESNGLLNRRTGLTRTGGSNPPLSAKAKAPILSTLARGWRFTFGVQWGYKGKRPEEGSRPPVCTPYSPVLGVQTGHTPEIAPPACLQWPRKRAGPRPRARAASAGNPRPGAAITRPVQCRGSAACVPRPQPAPVLPPGGCWSTGALTAGGGPRRRDAGGVGCVDPPEARRRHAWDAGRPAPSQSYPWGDPVLLPLNADCPAAEMAPNAEHSSRCTWSCPPRELCEYHPLASGLDLVSNDRA